ncbi:MAG: O-antigen ligase family protein, partial [Polyangiaceae bacterium]
PWAASWQTYLMLSGVVCALAIAANFRTPEHYVLLAKMLLAAATYRAVMCWAYYWFYIHPGLVYPLPEYLTSHDDTVLWVSCVLLLLLGLVDPLFRGKRVLLGFLLVLLLGAIFFNQRRLAWVSLGAGGALLLYLLPPSKAKRRTMRRLAMLSPVVMLYVAVGWGRPERIFRPLHALSTVTTAEDTSTKARNVENLGLIATSNASGMLMGTGWGHPYVEVSSKYSIAQYFPLWQYIPHNSILGLLAYTGVLGFCGYWMIFPTSMFLSARMARLAQSPHVRRMGALSAANLIVCANQFYGDMGIYYAKGVYMLSISYAIAMRLPVAAGVWPAPGPAPEERRHG